MTGKLYALGTGPGAADLITVRAAKILGQIDIIYAPAAKKTGESLALSIVREYIGVETQIKERHFPMTGKLEKKELAWQAVADEIEADVAQGGQVAFISLGDVMLYSTWIYILERLPDTVKVEIIPGVTSFAAIAAQTARPLAMETQSLVIIPCTIETEALELALTRHSCLVLMKVASHFSSVKQLIAKHGLLDCAVLVCDAFLDTEKRYYSLDEIDENGKLSYFSTILINKTFKEKGGKTV